MVDNSQRIVDGRNRRNAIRTLGGVRGSRPMHAPCRVVSQDEAAATILRTLLNRRHLTKGARAFLVWPLIEPRIAEARARQRTHLLRGNTPSDKNCGTGKSMPTMGDIAKDVGVHENTLRAAEKVHAALADAPENVRVDITARIVAGELELGYACTSIANYGREEKADLSKRDRHDEQFGKLWLKSRKQWLAATEEQRAAIRRKLDSEMRETPADMLEAVATSAAKALKALREGQT